MNAPLFYGQLGEVNLWLWESVLTAIEAFQLMQIRAHTAVKNSGILMVMAAILWRPNPGQADANKKSLASCSDDGDTWKLESLDID